MVAARAMVRDLFAVEENAKIFSSLMLVIAVSPIIAPTLGGYITAAWGWRWVFGALIIINLIILAAVHFMLPESKAPNPQYSLKARSIFQNFAEIFKHSQFFTYAFTGAIAASGLYAYISGSPNVFMEIFQVSEKQYGWIFATIAVGIISASQFNNLALRKYSSEQILKVTLPLQSIIGLTLAVLAALDMNGLFLTIFLIFLFLACQGFIFPNASALSMAPFGHSAGSASALMGAIQMFIGSAASALVSVLHFQSTLPMAGVMALCATLALLVFTFGNRRILRKANRTIIEEEDVEMISTL